MGKKKKLFDRGQNGGSVGKQQTKVFLRSAQVSYRTIGPLVLIISTTKADISEMKFKQVQKKKKCLAILKCSFLFRGFQL